MTAAAGAVLLLACSGPSTQPTPPSDGPQPVPECQAYEREVSRCTGIDADIASQPAALAQNDADRARLAHICSSNLERLHRSCR